MQKNICMNPPIWRVSRLALISLFMNITWKGRGFKLEKRTNFLKKFSKDVQKNRKKGLKKAENIVDFTEVTGYTVID